MTAPETVQVNPLSQTQQIPANHGDEARGAELAKTGLPASAAAWIQPRSRADRTWMKLRLGFVERPFATMKRMMDNPRFLVRGLRKAKSELALEALGFNLKRAMAILGARA